MHIKRTSPRRIRKIKSTVPHVKVRKISTKKEETTGKYSLGASIVKPKLPKANAQKICKSFFFF
jgi:hypothetical protein